MGDVTNATNEEPTLRDLIAAKALPTLIDIGHDDDGNEVWTPNEVAIAAYGYADAMLAARSQP